MSYSSSGSVATLWSPSNYNGTTKMPVPSAGRRFSTNTGTTSYRTTGSTDRPYYSSATGSYTSASRTIQTEYRSRYTAPIRTSTSVPTSYSRLTEIHESSNRISNKERSEANDSNLISYSRSNKTDNDVTATLEKYGLKTDNYKIRSDNIPNRFLNTSNLDSKYSLNRKYGGTTLELTRYSSSNSATSKPKTVLSSKVQRKDSLTKSDNTDSSPSPIRSIERKSSSSAIGGSSSPIEIRKSSEVWDKPLSVSYGENTSKGIFESDLFKKIDNKNHVKLASRESSEDLSESSIILENIENEEKSLSFAEIRKKFDSNDLKNGFDNCQKSSQSDEPKASISNGVILGVYNFGQMQYLDRNTKCKKMIDNSVDETDAEIIEVDKIQTDNSFSSPQTLRGLTLKPIPSNLKNNNNNCPALKKSPDPSSETNIKKRSSPDLKKNLSNSSPEKKEGLLPLMKLPAIPTSENDIDSEKKSEEGTFKKETRSSSVSSKLGLDSKNDTKIQSKQKGEKLLAKVEQTLSKTGDLDLEVMNTLSRIKRSPESKPKDFENHTKIIELRRIEPLNASVLDMESRKTKDQEGKEKAKDKKSESPTFGSKINDKSPQKIAKTEKISAKKSPDKEIPKPVVDNNTLSPKDSGNEVSPVLKSKRTSSPKEEKDSSNVRERDMNKKLMAEDPKDAKATKKEEKYKVDGTVSLTKEAPIRDKNDFSSNLNNRTFTGPSSSQCTNSQASNESLESAGIAGTSPRLGLSRSRSGKKGGLNGLRNIGNTCFMNSVIQCLSNTKPLLEYLLNEEYLSDINTTISGMKGALIKAFSNVIQELWAPNAEDRIVNTSNFKSQIQRFAPRFMGYSQQDAQEFLRYLLEGLHEDVNRVTVKPKPIITDIDDTLSDNQKATEAWKRYLRMDDSKVVDIFVGQLKSTLQCTVCGHCSVTFDPFWDLSLPVPSRTGQLRITSCLDAFTKEEVLDGDEKPTCSKCKTRRKCTKTFSIQKFPKILVLHLKRFSPLERFRGKLSVLVDFPLNGLDLSPYAANRGQGCTYNLYAISNHSGTTYSGHYTAYCKHPYNGNWHEYSDTRVSSLGSGSVVSSEAYVLFYELASQTSHL